MKPLSIDTSGEKHVNGDEEMASDDDLNIDESKAQEDELIAEAWRSPPISPVNGVVQPLVRAPSQKKTRHTNQLEFIRSDALRSVLRHKHAWPFKVPVDAVKLGLMVRLFSVQTAKKMMPLIGLSHKNQEAYGSGHCGAAVEERLLLLGERVH